MGRRVLLAFTIASLAACGGAPIPMHNGYKASNKEPWKKPKELKLDDQLSAKADGELDYKNYQRAKWYVVNVPKEGQLDIDLEVTPPSDDKFDLAMEVIDGQYFQVLTKSDKDDDDANETTKKKSLPDLKPGAYLIHLYLEGRLDTCEYDLSVKVTPAVKTAAQDDPNDTFPADVQFPPELAVVPLQDDTPIVKEPPHGGGGHGGHGGGGGGHTTTTTTTTATTGGGGPPVPAKIINVQVNGSSTTITFNRGTDAGLKDGSHGKVDGVGGSDFEAFGCSPKSCKGNVKATQDAINASGHVTVSP